MKAVIQMASRSKYYTGIPLERIQEMATHGLMIHPTSPEYLTCDHHVRKGKHICWPSPQHLCAHFDAKHNKIYDEWRCQAAAETKPLQEDTVDDATLLDLIENPTGILAPSQHETPSQSASSSEGMAMPSKFAPDS